MLNLTCTAEGDPMPTIRWTKDASYIIPNVQLENNNRNLVIRNVVIHNQGVYRCIAQNSAGDAFSSAMIVVQGKFNSMIPWDFEYQIFPFCSWPQSEPYLSDAIECQTSGVNFYRIYSIFTLFVFICGGRLPVLCWLVGAPPICHLAKNEKCALIPDSINCSNAHITYKRICRLW